MVQSLPVNLRGDVRQDISRPKEFDDPQAILEDMQKNKGMTVHVFYLVVLFTIFDCYDLWFCILNFLPYL